MVGTTLVAIGCGRPTPCLAYVPPPDRVTYEGTLAFEGDEVPEALQAELQRIVEAARRAPERVVIVLTGPFDRSDAVRRSVLRYGAPTSAISQRDRRPITSDPSAPAAAASGAVEVWFERYTR